MGSSPAQSVNLGKSSDPGLSLPYRGRSHALCSQLPPIPVVSDSGSRLPATVGRDFAKGYFWRGSGRHPASGECLPHAVGIFLFGDLTCVPT